MERMLYLNFQLLKHKHGRKGRVVVLEVIQFQLFCFKNLFNIIGLLLSNNALFNLTLMLSCFLNLSKKICLDNQLMLSCCHNRTFHDEVAQLGMVAIE